MPFKMCTRIAELSKDQGFSTTNILGEKKAIQSES